MKTRQLKSTHDNKYSAARLLKFLFFLLILSLSIGVTHSFAKTISGHIRHSTGSGINGVTLSFSNNVGSTITESSGYYIRGIPNGWSGTATPSKGGYSFDPKSRSYNNVTSNLSNQNYTGITGSKTFSITINIVGSGDVELDPDKKSYSKGSTVTLTGMADSGWVFSKWSGELTSHDNPESISINSDMTITAIFLLEDYDNDGVSDKEENTGPNSGDGNNDGIPDSLQSNVSYLVLDNATDYVAIETPPGTSINNFKAVVDPPDGNYPSDVDFLYGFFSFAVEGIGIGEATLVTLYFPSGYTFNTYSKYGPTSDNPFNHWYEFNFDGRTGSEINKNIITLNFVDGMKGDDDLTENGIIIDLGGPGIKTIIPSEFDSKSDGGGGDNYGCFVGCLL